jgi:hypothetical protein
MMDSGASTSPKAVLMALAGLPPFFAIPGGR